MIFKETVALKKYITHYFDHYIKKQKMYEVIWCIAVVLVIFLSLIRICIACRICADSGSIQSMSTMERQENERNERARLLSNQVS